MPITLLHLMLMSKIYVVKSDMKNVIGMSDLNVMFKGPGPLLPNSYSSDDQKKCIFQKVFFWESFVI